MSIPKKRYQIGLTLFTFLSMISINIASAQSTVMYYEDFSDSTLSNWTVIDHTNRGENWIWTKTYPTGHWRPNVPALVAPSSGNGFICFPADFYNLPYNPPTSGMDTMNAWITSNAIPIAPSSQLEIRFRQFLSYCCSTTGIISGIQLQLSSDSLNWVPFDVTSTNARSGSTANSELQIHNVSSVLLGEDTAYIRFRFSQNGWYYWMIDDVYIFGSIITSIEEIQSNNVVAVYPNPTEGLIEFKGVEEFEQVEVRDFNGRIVYQERLNESIQSLDLSFLKNGLYFLNFIGGRSVTQKLLINK